MVPGDGRTPFGSSSCNTALGATRRLSISIEASGSVPSRVFPILTDIRSLLVISSPRCCKLILFA